ncbi:hypothetical protein HW555_010497 [Spodoptera exigua]|uniref:Integral membrane protein 2 n=1 Tax=Spodoptera exigua TaxID=7107 RepID=A0A835L2I9_SPOEX|nr:hypothetical protein HW555_010497 [Spodoptera exigua]
MNFLSYALPHLSQSKQECFCLLLKYTFKNVNLYWNIKTYKMTVLTKPSLTIKKIPLIDESHCDGEIIEMQPTGPRKRHHSLGAIFCMAVTVFLLVLMGVITALQIYEQVTSDVSQHNRIQGFCSIPLNGDMEMLESHRMPLQWKAANVGTTIQVVSVTEDDDPDHLMDLLREVFDIDIDQSVEKISVFNNGHPVSFLHDFEANVTGIVDSERCFMMSLDPVGVVAPGELAAGLAAGAAFDVRRVRTPLRALLPPRPAPRALAHLCTDRPIYPLTRDVAVVIRKRSADAPPHDYMHFAGNGVQEIEISNLAELLQYEQDNKRTD